MTDKSNLNLLSEAVVEYLGYLEKPQPTSGPISKEFQSLLPEINKIIIFLDEIKVDWNQHTLASAGDDAKEKLRTQYPHLDELALDALRWKFTYDWR